MAIHSFSNKHLGTLEPGFWLAECTLAFNGERDRIKALAIAGMPLPGIYPVGWTLSDIDTHFASRIDEADNLSTFNLLAAAEAALRIDFVNRARRRIKSGSVLNAAFRTASANKWPRIALEADILDRWLHYHPGIASHLNNFKSALQTRHWFAHGRWWLFKKGQMKNHSAMELLITDLQSALAATSDGFHPTPL